MVTLHLERRNFKSGTTRCYEPVIWIGKINPGLKTRQNSRCRSKCIQRFLYQPRKSAFTSIKASDRKTANLMRLPLLNSLAGLACIALFGAPLVSAAPNPAVSDKPNFSGTWILDLGASSSLDALMNQLGASFIDRKYAAWTKLRAILRQSDEALTIEARGPAFAFNQTLYLDGRSDTSSLQLLGANSVNAKTTWSKDKKQLVETHKITTKKGKDGQLIIKRQLTDAGNTLVVAYSLKLDTESDQTSARQVWRKIESPASARSMESSGTELGVY